MFTIPALLSDITIATADLQRDDPVRFGDSPALAQSFGLFLSSFSGGTLVGPMVAGVLKVRAGWGAATLILALACAFASIPIVSINSSLLEALKTFPHKIVQEAHAGFAIIDAEDTSRPPQATNHECGWILTNDKRKDSRIIDLLTPRRIGRLEEGIGD